MNAVEATLKLIEELPSTLVNTLIEQLRCNQDVRLPNPAYQARVDELLRIGGQHRPELASMLEVALAAKHSRQSVELVWTGPSTSVVPVRRTEQVLLELIQEAQQKLTIMSFGIFQVSRVVQALEETLLRSVVVRVVLGDREAQTEWAIEQQRQQLGSVITDRGSLYWWPHERRLRDANGCAGLMHAKVAVADSRIAFLTSANLTEAALERNMELGILIRGGGAPFSIERLVDALIESSELKLI